LAPFFSSNNCRKISSTANQTLEKNVSGENIGEVSDLFRIFSHQWRSVSASFCGSSRGRGGFPKPSALPIKLESFTATSNQAVTGMKPEKRPTVKVLLY